MKTNNRMIINSNRKQMKKVILSIVMLVAISFASCKTEKKEATKVTEGVKTEIAVTSTTFGVRGNCGMCKATIEKAVNAVDGVTKADWNKDKKKIDVSFDDTKTNLMAMHNAIANSGYDTDKVMGSLEAYKGLPGCCQYDHEMAMNQTDAVKTNDDTH